MQVASSCFTGRDTLAILLMGYGKTMCAVACISAIKNSKRDAKCVIISPLISLMEDQITAVHKLGETACTMGVRLVYFKLFYIYNVLNFVLKQFICLCVIRLYNIISLYDSK
jgi:superfamily II DNA helicase RecQ